MPNLSEKQSKLDKHRDTIYRLYITENKTLPQVVDIMKRDHNLSASDKQYKRYFKIWGFEKNYKTSEMIPMLKIQQKRLKEGKKTVFFNENGEKIPKIKFTRFKNRHNIKEFKDEELQEVETPRGITYTTPEPEAKNNRSKNRLSTDRGCERTHMGAEESHFVVAQSSQSNPRDNIRREYYQLPGMPSLSSSMSHRDWSESQTGHFTRTVASPAPSAYSLNTTIGAPTATMAAYTSSHHGQFETNFSPQSTAISDPGEYQLSARLRQGSVSSMPPLDLNHSRFGLFTNTVPSPALSTCTLNTTLGCLNSSVAAYAPSENGPTYATGSHLQLSGTRNSVFNHSSASERPGSSSSINWQRNHVGPSSSILNSPAPSALSLNTTFGPDISSPYPFNNTIAAPVPLTFPLRGDGQFTVNVSYSPAHQVTAPSLSPTYGQGESPFSGPGYYNNTGGYGRYDGFSTGIVNSTYFPAFQSYIGGTEQYPSYNSNHSYTAGYQGGNGVDESLEFGSQSTTNGHQLNSLGQVNTFNPVAAQWPTALAREALAAMESMTSGPYSKQEPEAFSG